MLYDVIYHPFPINFQYVGVDSPAHIGILTGERPRFKRRTSHVPNLMHKLLKFIFTGNHCRPLNIVKMNWIQPGGGGGGVGTWLQYAWYFFRTPMIHRYMKSHPVAKLRLCFGAKHQDGRPMLFGFHSPRMKRCKPADLIFHGQFLYMWGKVSPNRFSRFQLSKCFYRKKYIYYGKSDRFR